MRFFSALMMMLTHYYGTLIEREDSVYMNIGVYG
jgi:hypothetical protein